MNAIRFFAGSFRRVPRIRDVNEVFDERLTVGERLADRVAAVGGSWGFIISFGVFIAVWVSINTFILLEHAYDPYPFILLNLALSLLAAIQAPIILMSQNRQASRDRLAAEHDYEVNLKAEIEIMALHEKVDEMRRAQPDAATGSAPDMRRDLAMIAERLGRIEERLLTARWTSGH